MKQLLTRWRRDRRGTAAVEFAFIAPVMIVFYLGTAELIQAFQASKRVTHVAAVIGDLAARRREVTDADLQNIFRAGEIVLAPFPKAGFSQRIASFSADEDGEVTMDWAVTNGVGGVDAPVAPADILEPGTSVIVADTAYAYQSPVALIMPGLTRMEQTAYNRPRLSAKVTKR